MSRHFTPWLDRLRRERSRERRVRNSSQRSRTALRVSICCTTRCCPISAKACCISHSESGPCWPTRWASARRSRRLPPASCSPAARASSACWWCARPRSRRSGRSRSHVSPSARRAPSSAHGRRALPPTASPHFFTIVNYEQVLARRRGHQRAAGARRRRARRGAAHQELADQDGAAGEVAALALRLRADRHADREPHRRALFDRAVSRPGAGRAAVPLQPRLLQARRARPAGRLQEPRRTARPRCAGDAPPPQVRRRGRTAGPHGEDLFRADGRGAGARATRTTSKRPPDLLAQAQRRPLRRRSSSACKCCSPACA